MRAGRSSASRGTNRAHLARAALEAIAFQSADVLLAMERDCAHPLLELRVDGGASVNNLLLQFQADLLGVAVVRPVVTQTTALGAAYLAGLGAGYWSSIEELGANWRIERRFEPLRSRDWAAQRLAGWAQAVGRAAGELKGTS
jgi:glycerol kinase